ncbi:MAG: flagellar hook-associated protein FlgK [Pseudomonadota bacterium]
MATSILSIGQSALTAAQVGAATTGHNIANASTPGYSRQVVVQGAAISQNFGFGFLGQGTVISTVKRVYNEFLANQVQGAQASKSALDSYYAQIKQVDNMLADPEAGLSPALQAFFGSVQTLTTDAASIPARQTVLSNAEALAARIQGMASRLTEIDRGINSQVTGSVEAINTYAEQIAQLNDAIGKAARATGQPPNDLLDQRDQLVLDLNKEIKTTVVKQGDGDYNVFIGNGQPLVVGTKTSRLFATTSPTDPQKIDVAYKASNGDTVYVGDNAFVGGALGGALKFRSESLVAAQNALGRIAIGLAATFNAQHQAGFDLNGAAGGAFFSAGAPVVGPNIANTGTAAIAATVVNAGALTTSNYNLRYDGSNYTLTRLADNSSTTFASLPQTIDGIAISLTGGAAAAGDTFLIRPTAMGASGFAVTLSDPAGIAAADAPGGVGNNANALALAALQTANTLANGTTTYQGAYGQLVSAVGNKTRELEVTSKAAGNLLQQATTAHQTESGVNLDEEATNLLRYQQAYQAAAKMMQIAKEMFDLLASLG